MARPPASNTLASLAVIVACDQRPAQLPETASQTDASQTSPADEHTPPPVEKREAVERPQTPEQFVGKHVLVPAGVPLFRAAKKDAESVKLSGGPSTFRVVDHQNGFLKLVHAKLDARCDDGKPERRDFTAPLFVEPGRVAAALARATSVAYADGTRVDLRPGVAVVQDGANGVVDAGGLRLTVAVDANDVGTAFTPTMTKRLADAPDRVSSGAKLRYGDGKKLVVDAALFSDDFGGFVVSRQDEDTDVLVEVLNGCATVRARVLPEELSGLMVEVGEAYGSGGLGLIRSRDGDARMRVTTRKLESRGALSAAKVKAEIETLVNGVKSCAEHWKPTGTGTLSIDVVVAGDGDPTHVEVSGIPELDSCAMRTVELWSLPEREKATVLEIELEVTREDP